MIRPAAAEGRGITPTTAYRKVRVGEFTPWGVAAPFCPDTTILGGRWACASHAEPEFTSTDTMRDHVDASIEPCAMTWRCRSCTGPHGWLPA